MKLKIDGEEYEVKKVYDGGYLPLIDIAGSKMDFYVAESSEGAGIAARKLWEDLARDDPKEFTCLVGEQTLIQWGMEHYAGPGSTQVKSLNDWLDLWLDIPKEEFASYDGNECEVTEADDELVEELGFTPTVAYRHN